MWGSDACGAGDFGVFQGLGHHSLSVGTCCWGAHRTGVPGFPQQLLGLCKVPLCPWVPPQPPRRRLHSAAQPAEHLQHISLATALATTLATGNHPGIPSTTTPSPQQPPQQPPQQLPRPLISNTSHHPGNHPTTLPLPQQSAQHYVRNISHHPNNRSSNHPRNCSDNLSSWQPFQKQQQILLLLPQQLPWKPPRQSLSNTYNHPKSCLAATPVTTQASFWPPSCILHVTSPISPTAPHALSCPTSIPSAQVPHVPRERLLAQPCW